MNKNIQTFPIWDLIADKIAESCDGVKYGEIQVVLKIHDGQIKNVTYSRTEKNIQDFAPRRIS